MGNPPMIRPTISDTAHATDSTEVDLRGTDGRIVVIERHRSRLKEAMSSVRSALDASITHGPEAWLADLALGLDSLRSALSHHIEIHEGADSFHGEILRSQPHLAARVTWLQRDHVTLSATLEAFRRRVGEAGVAAADHTGIRRKGDELLHGFVRHRRRGADLVWDAFEFDLGGEH
jgi:hypothetical protein